MYANLRGRYSGPDIDAVIIIEWLVIRAAAVFVSYFRYAWPGRSHQNGEVGVHAQKFSPRYPVYSPTINMFRGRNFSTCQLVF